MNQPDATTGLPEKKLPENRPAASILLVIGLSGAGKSTVLHTAEDMHLFTADGVPPALVIDLVRLLQESGADRGKGIALGLDQRRSDFGAEVERAIRKLGSLGFRVRILFLEAEPAVLLRRYATTRRPHPREREGVGLEQAILEEAESLAPVREMAERVIDTSRYSIHDLRRAIQKMWKNTAENVHALRVNIVSFGFKYGMPREAEMVFDLRCLPNPYFDEKLRPFSGKDKAVADYVFGDETARAFRRNLVDFVRNVLPLYDSEGRYRICIAIGCTGGKHRSVAMAEYLYRALKREAYTVSLEHRHMELG